MTTTAAAARGHWPRILSAFGIEPQFCNKKHHPCPVTGEGVDRFRFSDHEGYGRYFCQCSDGSAGGIELVMCKTGMDFKTAAAEIDKITGRDAPKDAVKPVYYSAKIRQIAKHIPRSRYLESRGLEMAPGLQFAESIEYRSGEEDGDLPMKLPAMLAPITRNGEFLTYHVTYLQNGGKAKVPTPRKIMPGPEWGGGACELYPVAGDCLGIAEGVETAIAAHILHPSIPVWAALNTSGMKNWKPPLGIETVVIFADNDANFAGHAAAYALAHKLYGKVKSVEVWMPVKSGTDWNDCLLSQRADGVKV